jgi:hypothetical protein
MPLSARLRNVDLALQCKRCGHLIVKKGFGSLRPPPSSAMNAKVKCVANLKAAGPKPLCIKPDPEPPSEIPPSWLVTKAMYWAPAVTCMSGE